MCCRENVSVTENCASAVALPVDGRSVVEQQKALPRPGVFARFLAVDDAGQRHRGFDRWTAAARCKYTDEKL